MRAAIELTEEKKGEIVCRVRKLDLSVSAKRCRKRGRKPFKSKI